jgi:hypothetical protein
MYLQLCFWLVWVDNRVILFSAMLTFLKNKQSIRQLQRIASGNTHIEDVDTGTVNTGPSLNGEQINENKALENENNYKATVNEKPRDCHSNC